MDTNSIQLLDDHARQAIDFGKLTILDISRIDDLINSSVIVSELEIVMFSRRMTSRCSEVLDTSKKTINNNSSNIEEDSFGIIKSTDLKDDIKLTLIKEIISKISLVIFSIKQYNKVIGKGQPNNSELITTLSGYYSQRNFMLQSWKSLILYFSKNSWKLPKFTVTQSQLALQSIIPVIQFHLTDFEPLLSISSSDQSKSVPTSPTKITPPTSPPPIHNSKADNDSSIINNSNVVTPNKRKGSFSSLIPIKISTNPIFTNPISSTTSNTISNNNHMYNDNPTFNSILLFDIIFQINIVLLNLLWHLKNQQRILMKKQQNQITLQSPTHQPTLSTSPTVGLYSTSPNQKQIPLGTLYIEQTKNYTISTLFTKLLEICSILNLLIDNQSSLISSLNNLSLNISNIDLINSVEDCITMFNNFSFNIKDVSLKNNQISPSQVPTTTTQKTKTNGKMTKHHSNNSDKTSPLKTFFNSKSKDKEKEKEKERDKDIEIIKIDVSPPLILGQVRPTSLNMSSLNMSSLNMSQTIPSKNIFTTEENNTSLEDNNSDNCINNNDRSRSNTIQVMESTTTTANQQVKIIIEDSSIINEKPYKTTDSQNIVPIIITTNTSIDNNNNNINNNNNNNSLSPPIVSITSFSEPTSTNSSLPTSPTSQSLNTSNNNNNITTTTTTTTTTSTTNTNKLEKLLGVSSTTLSKNLDREKRVKILDVLDIDDIDTKEKSKSNGKLKKKNTGWLTLSKHLKSLKVAEGHETNRNSFNQFWLEGSTHENRQDQLPLDEKQKHIITSLGSYVSNLVIKGLLASAAPIDPPKSDSYNSCVLFADISGFTALTERLGNHGKEGVELLTKNLNSYFTILIKIVKGFGGDIVKFAGDAVLAHWPSNGDITNRVRIACECALALQKKLHNFPVPGGFLTLHIGIGCGNISGIYVGGCNQKIEFLIAGQALHQATLCEKEAESGEIYISPDTHDRLKPFATFSSQKKGKINYKLESITTPFDKELYKQHTSDDLNSFTDMLNRYKFLQELPLLMDMEENLKRFVPNAVHNQFKSEYRAELRYITVIFINIMMDDPEHKLKDLQSIVKTLQSVVYKNEGTVRQFMVDDKGCVMIAAWGVPPYSHEDDASRAVEAAMEIVVEIFKLQVITTVGVTTGKCFCGDVGSDERREYAVVGDIVNLSARLMTHSKGGVLCDEETSKSAKRIQFVKLSDPIKVKGKQSMIAVYKPMKKIINTNQSPRSKIEYKGMIGRHEHVKQMANVIENLRMSNNSPSQVVILESESGLGKSRFLSEIKYSFCMDLIYHKGTGMQMNESISFYIWREILESFLKEEANNHYKSFEDLGPHITLLNEILGLDLKVPQSVRRYSAPQKAETLQMLMLSLVQKAIPPNSIIVIDDAQFMDSQSWTLTLNISKQINDLLIIVSQRPSKDGHLPFGFISNNINNNINDINSNNSSINNINENEKINLIKIKLEPLKSIEETHLFIEQILDDISSKDEINSNATVAATGDERNIPNEIIEEIFNRSQGNHFVIEEMINGLKLNSLIDERSGITQFKEAIELIQSSRTITSLITSRVDRLAPMQQLELKVASVVGMPFNLDYIYRLLPNNTITIDELSKDIKILVSLDFLRIKSQPNFKFRANSIIPSLPATIDTIEDQQLADRYYTFYSFHHRITQEVIYDLMLFSHRRELHDKIAILFESIHPLQNSLYITLAHHFHLAQNHPKTIEYSTKCGAIALTENNNKEAIRFFTLSLKSMHERNTMTQHEDEEKDKDKTQKKLHRRSSSTSLQNLNNNSNNSLDNSNNNNNNLSPQNNNNSNNNSNSNNSNNNNDDSNNDGNNSGIIKTPIEMISITRKLSLALFNIGLLQSSQVQLLQALKLLGIEMPIPNSSGSKNKIMAQRLTKSTRQDSLTKLFTIALDPMEKREAILCLILLSKISFNDCSRVILSWCSFVSLQICQENWSLMSEAYSIGIRALGISGNHVAPLKYYAEILSRSDETNSYVYGNSHQAWGVYMSGLGRWVEAETGYQKSTEAAGKVGDRKLMDESNIFLSVSYLLTGKLKEGFALVQKTLDSARDRGDLQIQISALITQTSSTFHLGDYERCKLLLSELELVIETLTTKELTNESLSNYHILKALMFLHDSQWTQSLEHCKIVYSIISKCEASNFTTYESYTSLPLVLIKLQPNLQKGQKITGDINDAMSILEKFANTFPIGQPRHLLCKAITMAINNKDPSDFEPIFLNSKEKSVKLNMAIEEAICIFYMNKYSINIQDSEKQQILSGCNRNNSSNNLNNSINLNNSNNSNGGGGGNNSLLSVTTTNTLTSSYERSVSQESLSSNESLSNSLTSLPTLNNNNNTTLSPKDTKDNSKHIFKKLGIKFWGS